jgi:hypothetical protein
MPIFLHGILFYNKISAIPWAITLVTKLKIYIGEESDKKKHRQINLTDTQITLEGLKYRKMCFTIST